MSRGVDDSLGVIVTSVGRTVGDDVGRDRCGHKWSIDVLVIVTKTLEQVPDDIDQPANYDVIDECVENAEYIADHLGTVKQVSGYSLTSIEHVVVVSDEWMRQSTMFVSEIVLRYI